MATTNFEQFNPTQANQETDSQYASDPARAGGVATGTPFASELANKVFFQSSTFITAFASMLVDAGVSTSDANLVTLKTQLASIVALLPSPAFEGTPTAPTAAASTNNTQLATTNFVHAVIALLFTVVLSDPGYFQVNLPSGVFIFQWGRTATTTGAGDVVAYPTAFPTACLGRLAVESNGSGSGWGASKATVYGTDDGSTPTTSFKLYSAEITSSGPSEQGGLTCFWLAWGH